MKVAVLGAGFQGVCVALELAKRGLTVDLFDKNERAITQAGYVNEGKIHLGFTFANDPTMRTAKLMIRGSLNFRKILNRWIDFDEEMARLSSPFLYAVHRDTLVPTNQIRAYFQHVQSLILNTNRREGSDYLGTPVDFVFDELESFEAAQLFDRGSVSAAFTTIERSVDTVSIANRLRDAITGSAHIRFFPGSLVKTICLKDPGISVEFLQDGKVSSEGYEHVVNALWDGRLAIDAAIGIPPKRRWLYRFKFGIRLNSVDIAEPVPTATIVLGRFGDIVRFPAGDAYLSWYPICLGGLSSDLRSPDWSAEPDESRSRFLFQQSVQGLASICPPLGQLRQMDIRTVKVHGGVIFAWGSSDIGDIRSELHSRFDVGPYSKGGYHSIDTGKYTLAPLFALEVADRICGIPTG